MKITNYIIGWSDGTDDQKFINVAKHYFVKNYWSKIENMEVTDLDMANSIFDCPPNPKLSINISIDTDIAVPVAKILNWNNAPEGLTITFEVE